MSNETKQTALDLFIEKLEEKAIEETEGLNQIHIVIDVNEYLELKKQSKEMEKEKQKYFFDCGRQYQLTGEGTFTQVYNETYGGNK
jgi:hypothetical protein